MVSGHEYEATKKTMLKGIKTRLGKEKGNLANELQHVLWSYQTTVQTPTREMSFSLIYGTESGVPIKVSIGTTRTTSPYKDFNAVNL